MIIGAHNPRTANYPRAKGDFRILHQRYILRVFQMSNFDKI